jgi:hypothetical protein
VLYDEAGMVSGLEPLPKIDTLLDVYLGDGTWTPYVTPFDVSLWDLVVSLCDAWHGRKAATAFLKREGLIV